MGNVTESVKRSILSIVENYATAIYLFVCLVGIYKIRIVLGGLSVMVDYLLCQYLDVMESIHAPLHYFSYAYSRIFNDIFFGEVCLNRFNFVDVNYDFLSTASRLWSLYSAGYYVYLENTRRTFSRVSLSYPI